MQTGGGPARTSSNAHTAPLGTMGLRILWKDGQAEWGEHRDTTYTRANALVDRPDGLSYT